MEVWAFQDLMCRDSSVMKPRLNTTIRTDC